MTGHLFKPQGGKNSCSEPLGAGTTLLHGFAATEAATLLAELQHIIASAPFRHMITTGGFPMSVAMSNCGALGWVTDRSGYRYETIDPQSGHPWPAMPEVFVDLARRSATLAGFSKFAPDACLINRYEPGAKMSLHQDKDERDLQAPIVSVSLGIPAVFLWGGMKRSDPQRRLALAHGDVLVWGGPDRLRYHGVLPVKVDHHVLVGDYRINLTFRKAA